MSADLPEPITLRPAGRPGDLGWVVRQHGEQYAAEYDWDITFEALVAGIMAEFGANLDRPGQAGWIAESGGQRVGCIFGMPTTDPAVAQLRTLLVTPAARGHGVGGLLVAECVTFARSAGYQRMVLWTNDVLVSARRLYVAAGFTVIDEDPHHSFGHDLVGQRWGLLL